MCNSATGFEMGGNGGNSIDCRCGWAGTSYRTESSSMIVWFAMKDPLVV